MATNQPPGSGQFTRSWVVVTALGFGLAFLSFFPGMLVLNPFLPKGLAYLGPSAMPEVLDPEALPARLDQQTYGSWYRVHLGYHAVALAVFGSVLGWFQSRVLRDLVPALPWVAATAAGYVAILCVELVERHAVVGPHAGPVEPLAISIGGSTLAGFGQWWVLRRAAPPIRAWPPPTSPRRSGGGDRCAGPAPRSRSPRRSRTRSVRRAPARRRSRRARYAA